MYLRPLQPVSDPQIHIIGDVKVDPSAVIAPGVILRAVSHSQIIIGAGVCIGSGTVINACGGVVEICCSASLGVGVLIVGAGEIGANACIGAATTIFNTSVKEMEVVQAGSLLGDSSRQVDLDSEEQSIDNSKTENVEEVETTPKIKEESPQSDRAKEEDNSETPIEEKSNLSEQNGQSETKPKSQAYIYGQMQVQQILGTIFPHRQSGHNTPEDNP